MGINQATSLMNLIASLRKREVCGLVSTKAHIHIARLKLLFVAVKVIKGAVKYSLYDSRTPALLAFYGFMDRG
ncbi:MAG: hypothetical protein C4518_04745 [Desulfobacteraceae bacterium]|nr:MAG: hypothetical protein C4518_04745 [Desulfobacteraceae bacterium]